MNFKRPEARKGPPIISKSGETMVVVKLMYKTETKEAWLLVSVHSNNRPTLWNHKKVSADDSREKMIRDVEEAAEGLASYQCICYKDKHNPVAVARTAVEALKEVFDNAEKANKK